MREVQLDAHLACSGRVASSLEEAGAVGRVHAGPEIQSLPTLRKWSAALGEEINISCVGAEKVGGEHGCCVGCGVEGQREYGVVSEVFADRKVDPICFRR